MLTTKKWGAVFAVPGGWLLVALWLTGCQPSGPKALLEGERLIQQGKYEPAVEQLKIATTLLPRSAQAWNHLGLAHHGVFQVTEAQSAYQRALALDGNLAAAHYNLGCLWLDQSLAGKAIDEFKAFTLLEPTSSEGWLRLGTSQLRDRQFDAAEKSLTQVVKLTPGHPEALNQLGVIQIHKRRPKDAAPYFYAALAQRPNYGPALLNLAIVAHQYLNIRPLALQKYREYLATEAAPPNGPAVREAVRQLELELNPVAAAARTNLVAVPTAAAPATNAPTANVAAQTKPAPAHPPTAPASAPVVASPSPAKTDLVAVVKQPTPATETPEPARAPENSSASKDLAATSVSDPVGSKKADASSPTAATAAPSAPDAATPGTRSEADAPARSGFFHRLNPVNWVGGSKPKPQPIATPLTGTPTKTEAKTVTAAPASKPAPEAATTPPATAKPAAPTTVILPAFARYTYQSPPKPVAGDRAAAEREFARGVELHKRQRWSEAIDAYHAAVRLDPAYFEANYNLGLATYSAGDLPQALAADELALSINSTSLDTRYNFALALQKSNYPRDAAEELEKVVTAHPEETRAHLALANLYAQTLYQPAQARRHYTKTLQLDPANPQATAIRYWLAANPQ